MICCSTAFYDKVEGISKFLSDRGDEVVYPNGYLDNAFELADDVSKEEYTKFFRDMFKESADKIKNVDAIVVLNYNKVKNGIELPNYIGASTFLEMYEAFMNGKKIFMINGFPDNMLLDEIKGFNPIILDGDINNINNY